MLFWISLLNGCIMPQMGIHMIVGLGLGRVVYRCNLTFATGILFGSIVPDLDFIPLIMLRFIDRQLALSLHRHLTHSILFAASCCILGFLVSAFTKAKWLRLFGSGLAIGMIIHSLLDTLMWFSPIDLFWPLGDTINLYRYWTVSSVLWNVIMATEPLAYVLFLIYVFRTSTLCLSTIWKSIIWSLLVVFAILITLITILPRSSFEIVAYATAIPLGFCPAVALLIINRKNIFEKKQFRKETTSETAPYTSS